MECAVNDFIEVVGLCDLDDIDLSEQTFKQIAVPETVSIPEQKPDIEQILKVVVEGKVTRTKVIETPTATSNAGQNLTGKKLIIEGKIKQKVVYVAETDDGSQPVHSAEFELPFSTFIVLPAETPLETRFKVDVCIEDVFVEQLSPRELFKNLIVLFVAHKK